MPDYQFAEADWLISPINICRLHRPLSKRVDIIMLDVLSVLPKFAILYFQP